MSWSLFVYFAIVALLFWAAGAFFAWKDSRRMAVGLTAVGLLVFFSYILMMWVNLERPPMRTIGETRLWYSFFLALTGLFVYSRSHYRWILSFSTVMATLFVCVNLFKPEIHSKALMPALQSAWFAPHVIVYMFAYALLGASFLMSLWQIVRGGSSSLSSIDNLVNVGVAFMTIGMLFGALWAKEAWGHYWSWDPKETWAAITWLSYLSYIHYRHYPRQRTRIALWMLVVSFLLLQMCWWGINLLPSARGVSVHTYGS